MASAAHGLPGLALASTVLCTPASAFVSSAVPGATAPSKLGAILSEADAPRQQPEPRSTATTGGTYAVCTLAAAAAATHLVKRRPATVAKVLGKPIQVVEWQVDPKTPSPGSEKALAGMVGADVETGGVWDPLGFGKLFDRNFDFNMVMTYPHVQWLREAEIKHGRVCMLAFVGVLAQQFYQIPGYPAEPDWTKALAACYASKLPTLGVIQISVFTMLVEGRWYPDGAWIGQMDREPGDLGFDPLKYLKRPSSDLKELQTKELKNGRLAMVGLASLAANHAIPGSVPFLNGLGLYAQSDEGLVAPSAGSFCGSSAGAGLGQRQPATAARVLGRPIQVVEWQVDPKTPTPGSEKALATMVGADVETSGVWDPLGFGKLYDRNFDFNMVMTYPHVQWLREAEIKHGRVCMLAFVGVLAQQFYQIPGYPAEPDWTKALAACYAAKLPTLGVIQISVFAMLVEGRWYPEGAWIGQMDREPGDLGFDPLKYLKRPSSDLKELQLKELKNGRLAMIGLASLAANHNIPGSVPFLNGLGLYAQRSDDQVCSSSAQ